MRAFRSALARLSAGLAFLSSVVAQGTFVNFETPQVKPITVATVGGAEFLLVCNTPDDSVEIYDPATATPATQPVFLHRVPVGQGPASVRFDPVSACFYTANYIGDSVTKVQLARPGGTLQWSVVATKPVGESPADLAVSADGLTLFVTLAEASQLATLNATTLDPIGPKSLLTTLSGPNTFGVKEPRRIEIRNGARWVANMKGGNAHAPYSGTGSPAYDLDLWTFDPATSVTRVGSGLGTTNAGMVFGVDGKLYVVGSMARNEIADEANLKLMATATGGGTGFVESWLWVVDPTGSAPTVSTSRNLNRDTSGNAIIATRCCSQPMDIVLQQSGGSVTKIYIATFGSDSLLVLTPNGGPATTWGRMQIGVTITPQANSYGRNGPRGLVMNAAGTRLYCLNQLSNSVSVIDLANDTHAIRFALKFDPTPRVVREGRRFLYSAEFSGNRTVACSSCHVDGRTDSLGWDLGTPHLAALPHPVGLDDVIADPQTPPLFGVDKGILVTQSLQGLVNHPVSGGGQDLFSNKPYHWRGDRADFLAFNGAFVDLLGGGSSLSTPQMTVYRDFINTVMYTPNPEQAPDRRYRGMFGNPDDMASGNDALRGLKLFHTDALFRCQNRSCVHCHWLPEGSNNKNTELDLETAATRSLFQREGRAEAGVQGIGSIIGESNVLTSHFGLTRDGHPHGPPPGTPQSGLVVTGPATIDRFVLDSFAGQNDPVMFANRIDVARFMREMDTGVAPGIGVSYTVTFANKSQLVTSNMFDLLEAQVREANIGFALHARIGGAPRGYYFDISGASEVYRQHGTATTLTRTALLNLVAAADVLVLQGTAAGSERRVASVNGQPGTLSGVAPANITLLPVRPATQWEPVPQLTHNWDPFDLANGFQFNGPNAPLSLKTLRLLQRGLVQFAPSFGLTQLRHEAPRRFAVSGDNLRLGARLQLRVPAPAVAGTAPPYADVFANTILVEMGLYPTSQLVGGKRVWETTVEADPLTIYTLLLGGPAATGVAAAVDTPWTVAESLSLPAGTFDPMLWNKFHVIVVNENGTASVGSWQTLTIQ